MKTNLRKYLVEFIGTFFLVFTVGACLIMGTASVLPPFAIGAVLMVMVYAGGYISGGHYNPAVSLAACLRGALPGKHLVPYWAAQLIGGICASYLVLYLAKDMIMSSAIGFGTVHILIAEFLFTFALCYVVLQTATTHSTEGNSYYGLAIGSTVMAGAFAVGGIAPAAFNPAVGLGLGLMGLVIWKSIIYTVIANLLGGIAAAIAFNMTCPCREPKK